MPYPILPRIERLPEQQRIESAYARDEILHIRHHSLFAPRDFDLSPYFQIVKPTIASAFDPHKLRWADRQDQGDPISIVAPVELPSSRMLASHATRGAKSSETIAADEAILD